MKKGIIGKKIGMTQIFDEKGNVIPVTVVEAGPCVVAQKKTVENDGYNAVQVGFGDVRANKVSKPAKGHFAKADVAPKKELKEFRLEDCDALNVGDIIKADVFAEGDIVDGTRRQQRKRLCRHHQAFQQPQPERHPWYRPCTPSCRLYGCGDRSVQNPEGQENAGSSGR